MKKHVVVQREYEKGWGSKDFVAVEYADEKTAKVKVDELNANNTGPVPDYYIQARYEPEMDDSQFDSINRW
jgi:hypothetical protein